MNVGSQSAEEPDAQPESYALRILPRAERDILAETARLAELVGDAAAVEWQEGLFRAIARLATSPRRCAFAPERRLFRREVRQLIYRRTPSAPAYRILFTVQDDGEDGPTVAALHVRHGAQAPLTRVEAREIDASSEP